MKAPDISVIMAVYHGGSCIVPTIESILKQTFSNYEFIIVDDGSTDRTASIVKSYADKRIRFLKNQNNLGQTASLNVGLEHARGEYVARTDAGDLSTPDRFLRQIRFIEHHPEVDILGTDAFQFDASGKYLRTVSLANDKDIIYQRIFYTTPVVHVSVLMRRKPVLAIGGYDSRYRVLADYGLWSKALQNGMQFWNLRAILTGYIVDSGSFGAVHIAGRSVKEAAMIIQDNAAQFAGVDISLDEAESIFRFFVHGPLTFDRINAEQTADLIRRVLSQAGVSEREIDYLLVRTYLKEYITPKKGCLDYGMVNIGCMLRAIGSRQLHYECLSFLKEKIFRRNAGAAALDQLWSSSAPANK